METRFEGQLKKGVLEMLVLGLVAEKASYGYELILRLRGQSGGLLDLKEGTLYPILYRLEDDGQLTSSWTKPPEDAPPAPRGPMPKKTYSITEKGAATLAAERAAWRRFADCVNSFVKEDCP